MILAESGNADVCIVIPTMCEAHRGQTLMRAIASLQAQKGGAPQVIVVVNGNRADPALQAQLACVPGIRLIREAEGSLPKALRIGRAAVDTPWFGFLDDDDEYLADALQRRKEALHRSPQAAAVATQGWRWEAGQDSEAHAAPDPADLLQSLTRANWLASCGGLYRSGQVPTEWFVPEMAGLEWTYLAARLCLQAKVCYLGQPTFRIHVTPGSVSLSAAYCLKVINALQAILALSLPAGVRREFSRRLAAAHHDAAELMHAAGRTSAAWRHHGASLLLAGGLRYLSYTRHLLRRH